MQGWEEEEEDEDELPPLPLSPLGKFAFRESIEDYKSLLKSIDYQETTDLSFSFASRGHLEKLVDQYWDLSVRKQLASTSRSASSSISDTTEETLGRDYDGEVLSKLREMILHHPFSRVSPLLLRWPLLAADAPRPAWPLGDEVVALIMQKKKQLLKGNSKVDKEDDLIESMDADIALPTITTCQHALVGVLHNLAQRAESHPHRKSEKTIKRRDVIINWRDVLSIIASRPSVPVAVFRATQDRLEAIYGQVQYAPPSNWASNMGMGGHDQVFETLKREDSDPSKWQRIQRQKPPMDHNQLSRQLDRELLLPKSRKRARYLEAAPTKRRRVKRQNFI